MKGFKGFSKDLKCKGFQFEEGKTYKTDEVKIFEKGFHFCENPIDCFSYYVPADSRFFEVEGTGNIETKGDDSKVACSEIHIEVEMTLNALIQGAVKFVFDRATWMKE